MMLEQPKRKTKTRPGPVDKLVGATIKELRVTNGQTMRELARHLGISYQQVQKYEAGQSKMSTETLYLSASFLGVPIQDLFEDIHASDDIPALDSTPPKQDYRSFLRNPENVRLMTSFLQIGDLKLRRKFFELMDELVSLIDTPIQHEDLS